MTAQTTQTGPATPPAGEVHAFQAEMQQLLQIIIHSLYSEREIFLRELISNASDAINRLKFALLTRGEARDKDAPLEITLSLDKDQHTITVSDTGQGMTREEVVRNLGTIARSGTLEFVRSLAAADATQRTNMIGQFGVGFYSVFMVAKRVVVDTCPADPAQPATRWVSEGAGEFTILPGERTQRGTAVRVELKPDAEEFCTPWRVEEIVKRYSNFVPHPVRLEARQLNAQEAIWAQPKGTPTEEQYAEFYKFLTHETDDPLHAMHIAIEAPVQFKALLYIPKRLTNEVLYSPTAFGLQLYASKVMIQADSQDLLPLYLRFLRGIVDSEDLPLNVSREMVQKSPLLAKLRTSLAGRVLRELKSLLEAHPERYAEFWKQYGRVLKEGLSGDAPNRERLLELARFHSTLDPEALISLKDYIGRMRDGQKEILYFSGPSREAAERHPNLEFFRQRGLEVLLLLDRAVDDFMMASLTEFEGKPFASIDSASLEAFKDAGPEPPAAQDALAGADLEGLVAYLKATLGERVGGVNPSKRLVDSPATLVNPDATAANMQKVMRMIGQDYQAPPKTLEINPAHPLIVRMGRLAKQTPPPGLVKDLAEQLLDNCLLMEGLLEHPERMVGRIQSLMAQAALTGDPD